MAVVIDKTSTHYLFGINKELLDLGAMEMDNALKHLLINVLNCDNTVSFTNGKGITRKFSINHTEGTLEGRGIKGFFAPYISENVQAEVLEDGCIHILESPPIVRRQLERFDIQPERLDKTLSVLTSMSGLSKGNEKWFSMYHHALDFIDDPNDDQLLCLPFLRDLDIYNYQVRTAQAVVKRFRGRVLLCDEVGLGKTVEAGMAMMEYVIRGLVKRILILVPPSLVEQWSTEMKRKFNQDFIQYDDPAFKEMGDSAWTHYPKIIASLSTAKRQNNRDAILRESYDMIIVDEAHHLKNQKTVAWDFVNRIKKKYILLLTATPVQNKLEELYNLITLLKPGQLKTYSYFKHNFVKDKEGLEAKNVDKLRMLLSQVMIRNKRSDVDIKFTKRKAITTYVSLPPEEQKLHDDLSGFIRKNYLDNDTQLTRFVLKTLQEEMGSSFHALVPTLGKVANADNISESERRVLQHYLSDADALTGQFYEGNAKALQLLKILTEFQDKMLIFTKYKATQRYLVEFLKNQGFLVAEFSGSMRRIEKEEQIAYFKDKAQLLVSTESGGEGRNLQFCNGMVNFDLPWNPMAIEQRIGRIHRIGQNRDVFVYNLAARNTIEYYILDLLDKKINMFELVVGEMDMILGDIEDEEDFSDIMMNAWVRAQDELAMINEMERIGNKLMDNKRQYLKVKQLDNTLFEDSLKTDTRSV